jgi:transposase-like protein
MRSHSTKAVRDPDIETLRAASGDERAAVEFFENLRWGSAPTCPSCAGTAVYKMAAATGTRHPKFRWRCRSCNWQYTVRAETVMEESLLPLRCWAYAFWKACASKKGISALQLSRELDINYKSALFLLNRVRLAMAEWLPPSGDGTESAPFEKLGCDGGTVEADETYVGGKPRPGNNEGRKPGRGTSKMPVFAVVERGGRVHMRVMPGIGGTKLRLTAKTLGTVVKECVDGSARLITDDYSAYRPIGRDHPGGHHAVKHSLGEYVRKGTDIHSNTAESVFSLLKRGVYGTYHSISKKHLPRYLSEFEYRWNTRWLEDGQRTFRAIRMAAGKRLVYREPETQTGTGG